MIRNIKQTYATKYGKEWTCNGRTTKLPIHWAINTYTPSLFYIYTLTPQR